MTLNVSGLMPASRLPLKAYKIKVLEKSNIPLKILTSTIVLGEPFYNLIILTESCMSCEFLEIS